jgi:hypothetical protein
MNKSLQLTAVLAALVMACAPVWAQDAPNGAATESAATEPATTDATKQAADKVDAFADEVNQSPQAQEVRAGILKPIYALAERLSFPAFHAVAFTVMVAGVVSFALQLVLGKLVVLTRMGFSPSEVLSDALGLAVSLVGLVLTTQAATENSTFTASAAAVLSATAVGVFAGFIFYIWGQRQELQAVEGRRRATSAQASTKSPTQT